MGKQSRRVSRRNRVRVGFELVGEIVEHELDEKYIERETRSLVESVNLSSGGLSVDWHNESQRGVGQLVVNMAGGMDNLMFSDGVLERVDGVFRQACQSVKLNSISIGGVHSSSEDFIVVISVMEMVREQCRKLMNS